MKTVGELKKWLSDKDDSLPVELMIETEDEGGCQYQLPMNDVAVHHSHTGSQKYVVIMHEKW